MAECVRLLVVVCIERFSILHPLRLLPGLRKRQQHWCTLASAFFDLSLEKTMDFSFYFVIFCCCPDSSFRERGCTIINDGSCRISMKVITVHWNFCFRLCVVIEKVCFDIFVESDYLFGEAGFGRA